MIKARAVAVAEYLRAVRTKGFIIGIVMMPLLFGAGFFISVIGEKTKDLRDRHFAVVDHDGRLGPALVAAAEARNADVHDDEDPDRRVRARWIPELVEPDGDERIDLTLSRRVQQDELVGFVVLGADLVSPEAGGDETFAWHTDTPTSDDLPDWIRSVVTDTIRRLRFEGQGLDLGLVDRLSRVSRLRTLGLVNVEEGEIVEATEEDELALVLVPMIFAMLLYMLVMMSAPALMNNVLEEKMQRIAEVLVSSVSPFQLLLGKLLGAAMVCLTLAAVYVAAGLLFAHTMEGIPPQVLDVLGFRAIGWFSVFLVLSLLIYGSIFSALGAACTELQDAQSLMGPAIVLVIFPFFFLVPVLKAPDGTVATLVSLFPPATPMLMFLRVMVPPGVPWWQLGLALVLTTGFMLGCVLAAGKIFRIGVLSQGQTPSYRQLVRWIVQA